MSAINLLSFQALSARGQHDALVSRTASLSYERLASLSVALHEALSEAGIGAGEGVGLVSQGRGFDEAVGLVALVASDRVVVPLDASAPPLRLAAILTARGVRAVVADSGGAALVARAIPGLLCFVLNAAGDLAAREGAPSGAPNPLGAEVACVLHTSGSTGTPKPVPITTLGLHTFVAWMTGLLGLGAADRVFRVAELVFDLAWFDHVATLAAGATLLVPARRELAVGKGLVDAFSALRPSVVYGVPSLFMKLSSALPEQATLDPSLRAVCYAGEVFPPRELCEFSKRAPNAQVFNLFGPTETNVCTFHRVRPLDLDGVSETPIGLPCPYANCQLRSEDNQVIEGVGVGELYVSGPTVLGDGLFATRDRVERRSDGLFYFRGRVDRVAKIRGYRVDPGDVEAHLGAHVAVRQAAVLVDDDPRLGKVLRAVVALRSQVSEHELKAHVKERLPSYMVPESMAFVDELPLTPTGKIDYARL